jgi:hypothetical protein
VSINKVKNGNSTQAMRWSNNLNMLAFKNVHPRYFSIAAQFVPYPFKVWACIISTWVKVKHFFTTLLVVKKIWGALEILLFL